MVGAMGLPSRWQDLAHWPTSRLAKLAVKRLERSLREELLSLCQRHRRVAEQAGIDPLKPLAEQLGGVVPQTLAACQEWEVLVPDPQAIRAAWPLSRKIGLMVLGERGRRALAQAYALEEEWVEVSPGRTLAIQTTARDRELGSELASRCLDVLELQGRRALLALPGEQRLNALLQAGAAQVGSQLAEGPTDDFEADGLIASLAGLEELEQRRVRLDRVRVAALLHAGGHDDRERARVLLNALGAEQAELASLLHLPVARAAFAAAPGPDDSSPEYVHPLDLFWLEGGDPVVPWTAAPGGGTLFLTHLEHHGTALLRFDTGLALDRFHLEPCPRSGRTLPRFSLRN